MLKELRAELKANAEEAYRVGSSRFFKETIRPYGVRFANIRKIARKYFPKSLDERSLIALCDELWRSGWFEEGIVAIEWSKKAKVESLSVFENWLDKYVSNWAHVDGLCGNLIGPLLEKRPELISKVKSWHTSKNRWKRRASAVAFVVPGRHGKYLNDIFDVAEKLLADEDDMVRKGYGWMLKAAAGAHQKELFNFVMKHKNEMPRTALRYAIEKMPKELKKRAMAK